VQIEWGHSIIEAAATVIPIVLYLWSNKRKAKHDMDRRHEENQTILHEIVAEREYLPPHFHRERIGPLSAEEIRYKGDK